MHQEKHFCAPKSRQKSQHFTTSLDSVWLHLDSVWVSLSSWFTITTLLSTSEGPVPSFYFLSEFIRQVLWLLIHFCMRISEICASMCLQCLETIYIAFLHCSPTQSTLSLCTEFNIRKSTHEGPNTAWNMVNVGVMTRRNRFRGTIKQSWWFMGWYKLVQATESNGYNI